MRTLFCLVVGVAIGGCSGSTTTIGDTDAGGRPPDGGGLDGTTPDGGSTPDGSPGGACPADVPTDGASCASVDLYCEYGGTGPELLCSTTAHCNTNGKWSVIVPGKECIPSQAQNPSDCPSSFTGLPTGSACPNDNFATRCVYPEGMCGCLPCMGDGAMAKEWACQTYPTPDGCPEPRPRVGTPCTQEGKSCSYGGICDVTGSIPILQCQNGAWHIEPIAADCAIRQCGR
jgi:hypothetical protein